MGRICIFTINDAIYDQRIKRVANTLANSGNEVTWVCRQSADTDGKPLPIKYEKFKCIFSYGPLFYLEFALRQLTFCLRTSFDIYYCCDADTLFIPAMVKSFNKTNLIFDAHELFYEVPELFNQPFKKKTWMFVEKLGVSKAEVCITVSDSIADILQKRYKKQFLTIKNVPELKESISNTPREKIIIYQGVLNKGRQLEEAIKNMHLLPDYQLWICGKGDLEYDLHKLAEESNAKNVIFKGSLPKEELLNLTQKVRYGLNLLDTDSLSYRLSLANKFFDYANAGVVSVNNPLPEYSKFQSKYNHCILTDDFQGFISAIANIDDEKWSDLYNGSRQMLKENNWQMESKMLLECIDQGLKKFK
jgi:glycosyltransferase involved in cell wall biosynthesis